MEIHNKNRYKKKLDIIPEHRSMRFDYIPAVEADERYLNTNTQNEYVHEEIQEVKSEQHDKNKGINYRLRRNVAKIAIGTALLGVGRATNETVREVTDLVPQAVGQVLYPILDPALQRKIDISSDNTWPKTIDPAVNREFKSSTISRLDQSEMNIDNMELITNDGGELILGETGSIRSTFGDYVNNPEAAKHTSILQANEEVTFNISKDVYRIKSNQKYGKTAYVTKIDNFTHTTDGKETGLRTEVDDDGWVAIYENEAEFNPTNTPE